MGKRIAVNESKIIKDFPSYNDWKLTPKYIFIHDTASSQSALEEANRLQSASAYNNGIAHYYVDENGVYQLVYNNVKAYHAGDGVNGKGNGHGVSIEVCRSLPSGNFKSDSDKARYKKALDNAYKLAADLCEEWNIAPSSSTICQHREVCATACPYTQKVYYGSYETAKSESIKAINAHLKGSTIPKWHTHVFNNKYGKHYVPITIDGINRATWKEVNLKKQQTDFLKANSQDKMYLVKFTKDTNCYKDRDCTTKDGQFKAGEEVISQHDRTFNRG